MTLRLQAGFRHVLLEGRVCHPLGRAIGTDRYCGAQLNVYKYVFKVPIHCVTCDALRFLSLREWSDIIVGDIHILFSYEEICSTSIMHVIPLRWTSGLWADALA